MELSPNSTEHSPNGTIFSADGDYQDYDDYNYHYAGAEGLRNFGEWYKGYHGYLATVVCALGILANILNIVVLTRKNMVSSTNCILTGLAMSDGLTMAAYLPFALRFYCLYGVDSSPERNTQAFARFVLFYACFSVVVHTVSIWLTVTLATFRYLFIRLPHRGVVWCSLRRAKIAIFLVYVVTLIICVPNFATITVISERFNSTDGNGTFRLWFVSFRKTTPMEKTLHDVNFWIQAILAKLIPCIGLTILSILLVKSMREADKRRQKLLNKPGKNREHDNYSRTNRTTLMLLCVVILFLVTEFPQGILNLLSGILPPFYGEIYTPLGEIMDILALINNGINFILYCTMSKQFRDTFIEVFVPSNIKNKDMFTRVSQKDDI